MKPTTIIVLAVLLAGAGLYIVLRQSRSQTLPSGPQPVRLMDLDAAQVQQVRVEQDGAEMVALVRRDGRWEFAQDGQGRVDQARADELVDTVTALVGRPEGAAMPPEALVRVVLTTAGGDRQILTVTSREQTQPGGVATYVTLANAQSYWVPGRLAERLDHPATWYQDLLVLDLDSGRMQRISVAGPQPYELAREDGRWEVRQDGRRSPADQQAVGRLISHLSYLRASGCASRFVTPAAGGFEPPQRVVQIELADQPAPTGPPDAGRVQPQPAPATALTTGEALTQPDEPALAAAPATAQSQPASTQPARQKIVLELGSQTDQGVYARRVGQPGIYELPASELEAMAPPLASIVDYRLLDVQADQVSAVELVGGDQPIRLERKGEGWRVTQPLDWPAQAGRVGQLVAALVGLKSQQAPQQGPIAAPSQWTWRLTTDDGSEIMVAVGPASPSGDHRLVSTSYQDRFGQVQAKDVEPLLAPATSYLDCHLVHLEAGQELVQLDIQGRHDGDVALRRTDGQWLTASGQPAGAEPVAAALAAIQAPATQIVSLGSLPAELAEADARLLVRLGVAMPPAAGAPTAASTEGAPDQTAPAQTAPATATSGPQTQEALAQTQETPAQTQQVPAQTQQVPAQTRSAVRITKVLELAVARKGSAVLLWREDLPELVVARYELGLYEALVAPMTPPPAP